jgi:hypothetical protein
MTTGKTMSTTDDTSTTAAAGPVLSEWLGPLPEPEVHDAAGYRRAYTADQMRAYALQERAARRPLTRDQIAVVATYAPEGVTDSEVAEIVFKVELMHGIRA